jgi:hypothetical protein
MMQRRMAELIFLRPADVYPAITELDELGFELRELDDWIDTETGARWILATIASELTPSGFHDWINTIIEPLGGDVVEAGRAPDDVEAWIRSKS